MANLTRFDPFADPFEDLVRRMLKPVRWESDTQPLQIKVDVEENDKAYTVKAEIPGVKKEDINVQIEGNQVSISAEIEAGEGREGERQGDPQRALLRFAVSAASRSARMWTRRPRTRSTPTAFFS